MKKRGGGLILSHFLVDFGILKIFTSVRHFKGAKNTFFKKCPNSGLVSEKKYIVLFVTIGGGGGVRPNLKFFKIFFFFFN